MGAGLPVALCCQLMRSNTPPEGRLSYLAMLRTIVNDAETHHALVEANVVVAVVKQVRGGDVCGEWEGKWEDESFYILH